MAVSGMGLRFGWPQIFLRVRAEFFGAVQAAKIVGAAVVLDCGSRGFGVNLHTADWVTDCCVGHWVSVLVSGRVLFVPVFLGNFAMRHGTGRDEVHPAFGALAGLVGDNVGVGRHGAGVEHGGLRVESPAFAWLGRDR